MADQEKGIRFWFRLHMMDLVRVAIALVLFFFVGPVLTTSLSNLTSGFKMPISRAETTTECWKAAPTPAPTQASSLTSRRNAPPEQPKPNPPTESEHRLTNSSSSTLGEWTLVSLFAVHLIAFGLLLWAIVALCRER